MWCLHLSSIPWCPFQTISIAIGYIESSDCTIVGSIWTSSVFWSWQVQPVIDFELFTVSAKLSYKKEAHHSWVTQPFVKSIHGHMILLLLIISLHSQTLCQIPEAWSNSRFPPILQVPVSYTYVFKNMRIDLWHIFFCSPHGWTFCLFSIGNWCNWNFECGKPIIWIFPLFLPCRQVSMFRRFL